MLIETHCRKNVFCSKDNIFRPNRPNCARRTSAARWQTAQPPASPQWPSASWCPPASAALSLAKAAARLKKSERYASSFRSQTKADAGVIPRPPSSPTSLWFVVLSVNQCSGPSGRRHAAQLHGARHQHSWHAPVDHRVRQADLCCHARGKQEPT